MGSADLLTASRHMMMRSHLTSPSFTHTFLLVIENDCIASRVERERSIAGKVYEFSMRMKEVEDKEDGCGSEIRRKYLFP